MGSLAAWVFGIYFFAVAGYVVLDGFDLGAGMLSGLVRDPELKTKIRRSLLPYWDGNEVWLLTAGALLFAAFAPVYATVFSTCYLALVLLLVAFIGRAVALEFRDRDTSPLWQKVCDQVFTWTSFLIPLVLGVAGGNIVRGFPIPADGVVHFNLLQLFHPVSIGFGLATVLLCIIHGSHFLGIKLGGGKNPFLAKTSVSMIILTGVVLAAVVAYAFKFEPILFNRFFGVPGIQWILLGLGAGLFLTALAAGNSRFGLAFFLSSVAAGGLLAWGAYALFPVLLPSTINPAFDLTINNSASTARSLIGVIWIAGIGFPIVVLYTSLVYWILGRQTRAVAVSKVLPKKKSRR